MIVRLHTVEGVHVKSHVYWADVQLVKVILMYNGGIVPDSTKENIYFKENSITKCICQLTDARSKSFMASSNIPFLTNSSAIISQAILASMYVLSN